MSKLTRYEKEKLRDLVLQCTVRRLSCNESISFVAERLGGGGKPISIRHIERVKQKIKQESTKWVYSYAKDHDLYVSEYRKLLDELEINRKELWRIYSLNEGKNPMVQIAAQKALANITRMSCSFFDAMPVVMAIKSAIDNNINNNNRDYNLSAINNEDT